MSPPPRCRVAVESPWRSVRDTAVYAPAATHVCITRPRSHQQQPAQQPTDDDRHTTDDDGATDRHVCYTAYAWAGAGAAHASRGPARRWARRCHGCDAASEHMTRVPRGRAAMVGAVCSRQIDASASCRGGACAVRTQTTREHRARRRAERASSAPQAGRATPPPPPPPQSGGAVAAPRTPTPRRRRALRLAVVVVDAVRAVVTLAADRASGVLFVASVRLTTTQLTLLNSVALLSILVHYSHSF